MNLVVGATGLLGSEICRLLSSQGNSVRALVRTKSDPSKISQLESLNVEIARGDLKQPLSLADACYGVRAVISTASATLSKEEGDSIRTVDLEGQLNLIDAAKTAHVEHFVLISFPHADVKFPLQDAKRTVEDHLKNSGLDYTILQPTFFMEVWFSPGLGFDADNAKAQIYGSGEKKTNWISYKDVAKFAAGSITNSRARNAVIELGGPEALSPLEVVQIFEKARGQKFEIQFVPEQALRGQVEGDGDPLDKTFAALMLNYSQGTLIDMDETLKLFPVRLSSVSDFAQAIR